MYLNPIHNHFDKMYIVHALETNIIPFSALPDSPIWSSGSGAIKEIRLHEAEMKVSLSPVLQCSRLIS